MRRSLRDPAPRRPGTMSSARDHDETRFSAGTWKREARASTVSRLEYSRTRDRSRWRPCSRSRSRASSRNRRDSRSTEGQRKRQRERFLPGEPRRFRGGRGRMQLASARYHDDM